MPSFLDTECGLLTCIGTNHRQIPRRKFEFSTTFKMPNLFSAQYLPEGGVEQLGECSSKRKS